MALGLFGRGAKPAAPPEEPAMERKNSATGRVVAFATGGGRAVWSPRDTASLTRAGFTGNPVGFRAVKLIAEAAAAVPEIFLERLEARLRETSLCIVPLGIKSASLFESRTQIQRMQSHFAAKVSVFLRIEISGTTEFKV